MNKLNKDKITVSIVISVITIFLLLSVYLMSFLVIKKQNQVSQIPALDKKNLSELSEVISESADVDTKGKPNLEKFDFGNREPF